MVSERKIEIACEKFAEFGIDFRCPWQCDLDDLELERFEALKAALEAASSAQAPEGWQLVPIEPTPAMLAPYHGLNRTRDTSTLAERIYAAMLKAAPQPLAGKQ